MRTIFKVSVLATAVVLSSCLSVNISSIHSEEKITPIKKLFVMLRGSKSTEVFYENMRFGLFEGFNKRSIQSSYYIKRALSLETDADVAKRMTDFAPDQVLTMDLSESSYSSGQIESTTYSFDIRLMNPDLSKIVWRATLDLKSSVKSEAAAKKAAESVINKMAEDGLFGKN